MTGFGKGEAVGSNFTLTTEIKTVNNRFKDYKFRMSSMFNSIELELRSRLEAEFRRGSFDISVSYKRNEKSGVEFQVDLNKVEAYLNLLAPVLDKTKFSHHVNATEFMRSDFYKDEDDQ